MISAISGAHDGPPSAGMPSGFLPGRFVKDSSIASAGSILSIGSTGSILSIGSAGSILSIGSAGSVASIGSAGSALSLGSVASFGSVYSILSAWSVGGVLGTRVVSEAVLRAMGGVFWQKLTARRPR
jgi:hypothetical protein